MKKEGGCWCCAPLSTHASACALVCTESQDTSAPLKRGVDISAATSDNPHMCLEAGQVAEKH